MEKSMLNAVLIICVFVVSNLAGSLFADVSFSEVAGGKEYGLEDLVLENEFLKVTIDKQLGGRIKSFMYKPSSCEYTWWGQDITKSDSGGGLMGDCFGVDGYTGEFNLTVYGYEILTKTDKEIRLKLSTIGRGPISQDLEISKVFILRENQPYLKIDLSIKNTGWGERPFSYNSHNCVQLGDQLNPNEDECIAPTTRGLTDMREIVDRKKRRDWFIKNMTAGWLGCMSPESLKGLALLFDYNELKQGLFWIGAPARGSTIEWWYRDLCLGPQDEWSTSIHAIPFEGLSSLFHVTESFAASIEKDETGFELKLYGLEDKEVSVSADLLSPDRKLVKKLKPKKVKLKPAEVSSCSWDYDIGVKDYIIALKAGNISFEHAVFTTDESKTKYAVLQPEKNPQAIKKGERPEKVKLRKQIEEGGTKKIKALVLSTRVFRFGTRLDVIRYFTRAANLIKDLCDKNRFDIDIAYETSFVEKDNDFLSKIADLYSYDVIVLNDFRASLIEPYVEDIIEYVKDGHGLVILGGLCSFGGRESDEDDYKFNKKEKGQAAYGSYLKTSCRELLPVKIISSPDWQKQRSNIKVNIPTHPVIAGIPLNEADFTYHKVEPKDNSLVIASTQEGAPLIVVKELGKGRVAAITISDFHNQYVWGYMKKLYAQTLNWVSHREVEPVFSISRIVSPIKEKSDVHIKVNPYKKTSPGKLDINVQGPDNKIYFSGKAVSPDDRCMLEINKNWPNGEYLAIAKSPNHTAYSAFTVDLKRSSRLKIDIKRNNFIRGEVIKVLPGVEGEIPDGTRLSCAIVDRFGKELIHIEHSVKSRDKALELDTKSLAYGEYKLYVAINTSSGLIDKYTHKINICKMPDMSFIISSAHTGQPMISRATVLGAFSDMKRHYFNSGFLGKSYRFKRGVQYHKAHGGHINYDLMEDRLDECIRYGITGYTIGTVATCHCASPHGIRHCQRDPANLKYIEDLVKKWLPYVKEYPGVVSVWIDDEPRGARAHHAFLSKYKCKYCDAEFKKEFGYDMPKDKWDLRARKDISKFYCDTLRMLLGNVAKAVKDIKPSWIVEAPANISDEPVMEGEWSWDTFSPSDSVYFNYYPKFGQICRLLFMHNIGRSVADRQNKPLLNVIGFHKNNLAEMRMQYWLAVGQAARGINWFIAHRFAIPQSQAINTERYERIARHHKFAKDNSGLFSRWNKMPTKLAVLHSRTNAAWIGLDDGTEMKVSKRWRFYRDVNIPEIIKTIYTAGLYPNVIDEEYIRDGSVDRYDVLVIPAVEVLDEDIIRLLGKYSKRHTVLIHPDAKVSIPGAKVFSLESLAKEVKPIFKAREKEIYLEPLEAGDIKYLVAYNHTFKDRKIKIKNNLKGTGAVYDMFNYKKLPGIQEIDVFLPSAEGSLYAFVPAEIEGIKVTTDKKEFRQGEKARLKIKLICSRKFRGITSCLINVYDPDGKLTDYSCSAALKDQRADFEIPFAINDKLGMWKIEAIDLITGSSCSQNLLLIQDK